MRKASVISIMLLFVTTAIAKAQDTQPEMADAMRANGKIYVVVLVLATIFAGIILYLVRLDRKITKLEKNK
jgi:hypothetical protein